MSISQIQKKEKNLRITLRLMIDIFKIVSPSHHTAVTLKNQGNANEIKTTPTKTKLKNEI